MAKCETRITLLHLGGAWHVSMTSGMTALSPPPTKTGFAIRLRSEMARIKRRANVINCGIVCVFREKSLTQRIN